MMEQEPKSLRILYLANYASRDAPSPSLIREKGNYPIYHHEMITVLNSLGLRVFPTQDTMDILASREHTDYLFSLLNRAPYRGSEIFPSALAEYLSLPYLGASPHARAVADDKYLAKLLMKALNIPTTESKVYESGSTITEEPHFNGPYFVKPRSGAASKYVDETSYVASKESLLAKLSWFRQMGTDALVEEYVPGTNISVPVIGGNEPTFLPPYSLFSNKFGQIVTHRQKRKLDTGLRRSIVLDDALRTNLYASCRKIYQHLGPIDYMRVEFRLPDDRKPIFTEINLCCNIGTRSGFTFSAGEYGLSHDAMIRKILNFSFARQKIVWEAL